MNLDSSVARQASLGRFGIWTATLDSEPVSRVREMANEIEDLGFSAVWIPEASGRDVFVQLYTILNSSRRLIGASGIANIWARDAIAMSAAANSLVEIFPDRVILGLGVSHAKLVDGVRGHVYERPFAAMQTYLQAMNDAAYSAPAPPVAAPRVLGALGPRMQRLAAEVADGIHPYLVTSEAIARSRDSLGRRPLLCPAVTVALDADRGTARAAVAMYLGLENYVRSFRRMGFTDGDFVDGGSDRLVDALVLHGSEDQILARLVEFLDAGADHICLNVVTVGRSVPLAAWRRLAPGLAELSRDYEPIKSEVMVSNASTIGTQGS